jgi:hypothetical protein
VGCFLSQGHPRPCKNTIHSANFIWPWHFPGCFGRRATWPCRKSAFAPRGPLSLPWHARPPRCPQPPHTTFNVSCLWHAPRCYSARGCYVVPVGHYTLHSTHQGNRALRCPCPVILRWQRTTLPVLLVRCRGARAMVPWQPLVCGRCCAVACVVLHCHVEHDGGARVALRGRDARGAPNPRKF